MKTPLAHLVALATAGFALGITATAADTSSSASRGDRSFLESAWKSGAEEIAVSGAALPNLTDVLTQEFAKMMVSDHTLVRTEISALAARKGLSLSTPEMREDLAKWEKKKDQDYDANYLAKMIKDHEVAVDLFTKASTGSDDPEVREFATKTLGTLKGHLTQAQGLKKSAK